MTTTFLCHSSHDSEFVIQVAQLLKRDVDDLYYYEQHQRSDEAFACQQDEKAANCNAMVAFIGPTFEQGEWQAHELSIALLAHNRKNDPKRKKFFTVCLPGPDGEACRPPAKFTWLESHPLKAIKGLGMAAAESVVQEIATMLKLQRKAMDGLPLVANMFDYEKDIINFFKAKRRYGASLYEECTTGRAKAKQDENDRRADMREKLLFGCPAEWPDVDRDLQRRPRPITNKLSPDDVGDFRDHDARVVAAALSSYHRSGGVMDCLSDDCMLGQGFCFREAGPREKLRYSPKDLLGVAVLVSGGIAPGINAVIDGIVQRHWMYAKEHRSPAPKVYGLMNGFQAFDDFDGSRRDLTPQAGVVGALVTSEHVGEGGSMLGTSRVPELLELDTRLVALTEIVTQLRAHHIDILYAVGGDGSMRAAHAIWSTAKGLNIPLSVVAIPKTMDNDILWVWQAFGFLSAVEKAREIIESLHTEVVSNPRLCVVQLFGSDSGFVVSHAVLASSTGHCDVALIPEVPFSMVGLAKWMKRKMWERGQQIPHGLVVMAETAVPTDAMDYVKRKKDSVYDVGLTPGEERAVERFASRRDCGYRIEGQTSDELRSAGLKIVSRGLPKLLSRAKVRVPNIHEPNWDKLRIVTNEPRHILRAIRPSSSDIIMGQRLGTLAVDNAMAGYTDFMVSQWLTEYVLVPLKLVVLGRKRIPRSGIFWKSVRAKTGQPDNMVT